MSPLRVLLVTAAIVAAALTIGAFAVAQIVDDPSEPRANNKRRTTQATSAPASPGPAGSGGHSSAPGKTGLITYTAVAGDDRAAEAAEMFDEYFSAINAGNYDHALDFYDPSGQVDTTDPAERADFEEGVATSTDSEIAIKSVADDASGNLVATVSFKSVQAPDKAPNGQTCTYWTVKYTLTRPGGAYRIFKGVATHDSCY
jgi:hypothetical protein